MNNPIAMTRRQLLRETGLGLGTAALATLLVQDGRAEALFDAKDLLPRTGQLAARAKSVILLFQNGGPSQMDLFDPKPELTRRHGEMVSIKNAMAGNSEALMASPFKFERRGCCPAWENRLTVSVWCGRCSTRIRITPAARTCSARAIAGRGARPWDRGSSMDWAAKIKTFPPMSVCEIRRCFIPAGRCR